MRTIFSYFDSFLRETPYTLNEFYILQFLNTEYDCSLRDLEIKLRDDYDGSVISNIDDEISERNYFSFSFNYFNDIGIDTDELLKILRAFDSELDFIALMLTDIVEEEVCIYWDLEDKKNELISNYHYSFQSRISKQTKANKEYIYLMVDDSTGYFKIGRSYNPEVREKTLQSEKPTIRLMKKWKAYRTTEKKLHEHFNSKRIRGEWFDLSKSDINNIPTLIKNIENR